MQYIQVFLLLVNKQQCIQKNIFRENIERHSEHGGATWSMECVKVNVLVLIFSRKART